MTDMEYKPIGWDDPINKMPEEDWNIILRAVRNTIRNDSRKNH